MHVLIVVAHHDPRSLTHGLALHVAEGLCQAGPGNSYEIADLSAQGFDPRFTAADHGLYHGQMPTPADVAAEQARIDRADALVLVFPVYWWSMPALLKGWIDRVFAKGWAFDFSADYALVKKLGRLPVHLLGVAGADQDTYERHGYAAAMKTQIDHGIFDFCGAPVLTSELVLESETQDPTAHLRAAHTLGRHLFSAAHEPAATA
ncbi:MAG: NAD(P)H-dependent oxidoreductase [Pseudomonas sp.]|uniref:NAD(P)H-dependent oxidoreductase n=1 Tax=Pseudomonas sp. TaxID=306 RepID=UPI00339942AB